MKKPKRVVLVVSFFGLLLLTVISTAIFLYRETTQVTYEETSANENLKAFPSAKGYGAKAKGGRGGRLIRVTNLNSDGEGSFKAAVTASGPRIVIFDVAGVITITEDIDIKEANLTIAGQTAPSPGITIKGSGLRIMANDIVIRNIAIRRGEFDDHEGDDIAIYYGATNVVIDHVSMNFAVDETFSVHNSTGHNVTVQNSILAFPLNCSIHEKGCHGYSILIDGDSKKISIINNLIGFATGRHPRIKEKSEVEFIENYVFNITDKCMTSEDSRLNLINNIYDNVKTCDRICDWQDGKIFASGNTCDGASNDILDDKHRAFSPVFPISSGVDLKGGALKQYLFINAGKNKPSRDAIDREVIKRFQNRQVGLIDKSSDLAGGFDLLKKGPIKSEVKDTDKDGMSDAFENEWGLNKNDPSDANKVSINGYTNIENYLNKLAGDNIGNPPQCSPKCDGKSCGADGCGGSCGSCGSGKYCQNGQCVCQPNCNGKECGSDGCGGICGACSTNQTCDSGSCIADQCTPKCDSKSCGSDGCGGSCGTCSNGDLCESGKCVEQCKPNCTGKDCGSDGCGGSCGSCERGESCQNNQCVVPNECNPQCDGKSCGSDGCGGTCGTCGNDKTCKDGQCIATEQCVSDCNGKTCGPDGCGGTCGVCASGQTCDQGECVNECTPSCISKECGSDGCGGSCGSCSGAEICSNNQCVSECTPSCDGNSCGDDGCGGSCGTCNDGATCNNGSCVTSCIPSCSGKQCGGDGCGGSCGTCGSGYSCINYLCIRNTTTSPDPTPTTQPSNTTYYPTSNNYYQSSTDQPLPATGIKESIFYGMIFISSGLGIYLLSDSLIKIIDRKRNSGMKI